MKQLNLKQGTQEWLDTRLNYFTASEASAMLGLSPYMSRTGLLQQKKYGVEKPVNDATQKLFEKGHEVENLARPIIEKLIGEDLYPVTGTIEIDGLKLLASFDGLTMMEDVAFEHKIFNKKLFSSVAKGIIPDGYKPQLEQQLMVSGAEKVIFVVSDGTEENMAQAEYFSDSELRGKIISGWKQFKKDLETFEIVEAETKPEANAIMELPALDISIIGEVSRSNLEIYKSTALHFIQNINTDLQTDQDFADAENTIKFCDKAEKELESVKKSALSQTADIDLLFKTIDHLKAEMRSKRLTLNKLVKTQKEAIKIKIISEASKKLDDHIESLNSELKTVRLLNIKADFLGSIKGKRNLNAMHDAIDTELANAKIEADKMAAGIRKNLDYIVNKYGDKYDMLFADMQEIAMKEHELFVNIVDNRIDQHVEQEAKRIEIERERIRIEEQRKAEREAQEKIEAERAKIIKSQKLAKEKQEKFEADHTRIIEKNKKEQQIIEEQEHIKTHEPEKTITILLSEYEKLKKNDAILNSLYAAGVDKWVGYDDAISDFLD